MRDDYHITLALNPWLILDLHQAQTVYERLAAIREPTDTELRARIMTWNELRHLRATLGMVVYQQLARTGALDPCDHGTVDDFYNGHGMCTECGELIYIGEPQQ